MFRLSSVLSTFLWFAAVGAAVGGCSWAHAPDATEAVLAPRKLDDPGGRNASARLYPVEEGYWVHHVPPGGSSELEIPRGRIAVYRAGEGRRPGALFAVVAQRRWGHLLQRLDPGPPTGMGPRGELTVLPLEGDDAGRIPLTESEACLGSGGFGESGCLEGAPRGSRWTLYALGASGDIRTRSLRSPGFAVPREGLLHRSIFGGGWQRLAGAGEPPSRWLAVRLPGRYLEPAAGRVLADPECDLAPSTLENTGLSVERTSLERLTHPFEIEANAYESMADAFVTCSGDREEVAVPALFRAPASTMRGRPLGPNLLGMRPVELSSLSPSARAHLLKTATAAARGDWTLADAHLERVADEAGRERIGGLLRRGAQLAAAAGRPEVALRRAHVASRSRWDRTSDPIDALARAFAQRSFGRESAFASGLMKTERLTRAEGGDGSALSLWLDWIRIRTSPGVPSDPSLDELRETYRDEGRDTWALAVQLEELRRMTSGTNPGDGPTLGWSKERVQRLQKTAFMPLFEAVTTSRGRGVSCPEAGEPCPLDVYGRRLRAMLEAAEPTGTYRATAERLARNGYALFQPAFRFDVPVASALRTHSRDSAPPLFAIVGPHLARLDDEALVDLGRGLGSAIQAGTHCNRDVPDWLPAYLEVMSTRKPGRSKLGREVAALAHWFYTDVAAMECGRPDEIADQLQQLVGSSESMAAAAMPLFEKLLSRAETHERRLTVAERGADVATLHGSGSTCKRWHLALSAAYAEAPRFERAKSHLADALNCPSVDDRAFERGQHMVTAYISFERSGSFPRDLDQWAERALERALHMRTEADAEKASSCIGLEPFAYELLSHLPEPIGELASAIAPLGRKTSDSKELELTTSSRMLAEAERRLVKVGARLEKPITRSEEAPPSSPPEEGEATAEEGSNGERDESSAASASTNGTSEPAASGSDGPSVVETVDSGGASPRSVDFTADKADSNASGPAAMLARVHALYRKRGHQPGLALVRFLSQQLFGVEPAALESWTPPDSDPCVSKESETANAEETEKPTPTSPAELRCALRSERAATLVERLRSRSASLSSSARRAAVAAAILVDTPDEWRSLLSEIVEPEAFESLCTVPKDDATAGGLEIRR